MPGITFEYTKPQAPEVAEGIWPADFKSATLEEHPDWATEKNKYGNPDDGRRIRWDFDVFVEGEAVAMNALSSTAIGTKSKQRLWTSAIVGRQLEFGEKVNLDDYEGKAKCRVLVENNTEGWPTITKVLPAK